MTTQCLLLIVFSSAATAQGEQSEANTLQAIRTAVRENFTSIHSLDLRYYRHDKDRDFVTWEWAIQGDKFLLRHDIGQSAGTPAGIETQEWISFDGTKGYYIDYDPADQSQVRSILRSSSPPWQYKGSATILHLLGWHLTGSEETFLALLDRATLVGKEEVERHDCWKIEVLTKNSSATNRFTAWIDPAVGYWPRRLAMWPEWYKPGVRYDGAVLARGEMKWDNIATEFGQFDDLALGGKRWFPTRFRGKGFDKTEVVLENIRINPPLPDTRFAPEILDGTYITDEPATPDQVSSYSGSKDDAFEVYKKQVAGETQRLRALGGPMVDASRDKWWTWPSILFITCAVVLIVGGGLWFRVRRG